jgi:hypothetical protein
VHTCFQINFCFCIWDVTTWRARRFGSQNHMLLPKLENRTKQEKSYEYLFNSFCQRAWTCVPTSDCLWENISVGAYGKKNNSYCSKRPHMSFLCAPIICLFAQTINHTCLFLSKVWHAVRKHVHIHPNNFFFIFMYFLFSYSDRSIWAWHIIEFRYFTWEDHNVRRKS